jgi:hypothetical protein
MTGGPQLSFNSTSDSACSNDSDLNEIFSFQRVVVVARTLAAMTRLRRD